MELGLYPIHFFIMKKLTEDEVRDLARKKLDF
jgi:hypothetical protein